MLSMCNNLTTNSHIKMHMIDNGDYNHDDNNDYNKIMMH